LAGRPRINQFPIIRHVISESKNATDNPVSALGVAPLRQSRINADYPHRFSDARIAWWTISKWLAGHLTGQPISNCPPGDSSP